MGKGNQNLKKFFSHAKFFSSFNSENNIKSDNSIDEYCFIGRSNVGKSSIINSLTNNHSLAKTSKTPGRTQTINFFILRNHLYIVDLPGYGYAKVSKVVQNQLSELIKNYLKYRSTLKHIFVLIDSKVGIKNSDIDIFDLIYSYEKMFSIIFTKADKSSKSYMEQQKKSLLTLMKNYPKSFSEIFFTSSKNKEGIIDVQKQIYRLSQIK